MTLPRLLIALALLFLTPLTTFSQDTTIVKDRPKVGLVLSGGGAKVPDFAASRGNTCYIGT